MVCGIKGGCKPLTFYKARSPFSCLPRIYASEFPLQHIKELCIKDNHNNLLIKQHKFNSIKNKYEKYQTSKKY